MKTPDRKRAKNKAYYWSNREKMLGLGEQWREDNRESIIQYRKEWYARQPSIVYAWFAPDGECSYVGRGTRQRAKWHAYPSSKSPWWTPEHMLVYMTCEYQWQTMELEGRWIGRYLPRFNKEGYQRKP